MPQGIQVWDANGQLVLDVTDRLTRFVDAIFIPGSASGSVQLPTGSVWWSIINNNSPAVRGSAYRPLISVSGSNLLSYSPNTSYGAGVVDCTLLVGVW